MASRIIDQETIDRVAKALAVALHGKNVLQHWPNDWETYNAFGFTVDDMRGLAEAALNELDWPPPREVYELQASNRQIHNAKLAHIKLHQLPEPPAIPAVPSVRLGRFRRLWMSLKAWMKL